MELKHESVIYATEFIMESLLRGSGAPIEATGWSFIFYFLISASLGLSSITSLLDMEEV